MLKPLVRLLALGALGALSVKAAYAVSQKYQTNTQAGVYTVAQAEVGRELYDSACASCHGANLEGAFDTPPLKGRMVRNWSEYSVGALFGYVSDAMPQMMPGSLSPDDNAAIIAYILQKNGMPAGEVALASDRDVLSKIEFRPVSAAVAAKAN